MKNTRHAGRKLVQIGMVEVDSGMVCIADPCRAVRLNGYAGQTADAEKSRARKSR